MGSFRSPAATQLSASNNSSYRNSPPSADVRRPTLHDSQPESSAPSTGFLCDAGSILEAIVRRGDSPHTRRAYAIDLRTYAAWLLAETLEWDRVTADDLDRYREWLAERYARTTTNRRLSVIRSLYAEAFRRHRVADDPVARLRGLRGRDERDGGVLTRAEAREVMEAIRVDLRSSSRRLASLRNLALMGLLIRTGLRRSEVVGLRVGDFDTMQGHRVATLRAKGNVLRTIKIPTTR